MKVYYSKTYNLYRASVGNRYTDAYYSIEALIEGMEISEHVPEDVHTELLNSGYISLGEFLPEPKPLRVQSSNMFGYRVYDPNTKMRTLWFSYLTDAMKAETDYTDDPGKYPDLTTLTPNQIIKQVHQELGLSKFLGGTQAE